MIQLKTLGPVDLTIDGAPAPPELLWRKHLALLVYLARSPRGTRSREHLVGLLWPDKAESAARHSLNEALRVIRRAAGDAAIETRVDQVVLAPAGVECDADRFEALMAAGESRAAAELVLGEFLEGFAVPGASEFEDWVAAERLRLSRTAVQLLAAVAEEAGTQGDVRQAIEFAARARALDPLAEVGITAELRTLALSGDRARALELAEDYGSRLREDVGMEPSAAVTTLVERIRSGRLGAAVEGLILERASAARRRPPLVARSIQLREAYRQWQATIADRRGTMVLVLGDQGTGKSRFLEEVADRALLDGAVLIVVRAIAGDREEPESGLLAAASGGLRDLPGVAAAPPAALAAIGSRLQAWRERFPALRTSGPVLPGLGEAFQEVVRVVAEDAPVLVLLDDAEHLDPISLHAFAALTRVGQDRPVLVLASMNPTLASEDLTQLRAQVGPDRSIPGAVLQVTALDTGALHDLIRWALPHYQPPEVQRLGRRLAVDSAGLPLLVVELVSAVAAGMSLESGSSWPEPLRTLDQTMPGDLPEPVVAAIRVGFRQLGAPAQEVLAAMSVLRPRVTVAEVARATDRATDGITAALDELEWSRWVVAEVRGYAFAARIVRDVIARDMLTPGQRRRILERVAGQ